MFGKSLYLKASLAFFLFINIGFSQGNLLGTWSCVDVDLTDMLIGKSEEEKAMYESYLPMMEEAMKSMVMTFYVDGTMLTRAFTMSQENEDEGTWKLSADGKKLITKTLGQENADTIGIEKLDEGSMILVVHADGSNLKMTMAKKDENAAITIIDNSLFVGTWSCVKVDLTDMLAGLSEEEKAVYKEFLPMMEESMKSMEMTFHADGAMLTKATIDGKESEEKGTWKLNPYGNVLLTKTEDQETSDIIVIEKLDEESMILAMDADGDLIILTLVRK